MCRCLGRDGGAYSQPICRAVVGAQRPAHRGAHRSAELRADQRSFRWSNGGTELSPVANAIRFADPAPHISAFC